MSSERLKDAERGFYENISVNSKVLDTKRKFEDFFEDLAKTGNLHKVLRKYGYGVNGIYNYTPNGLIVTVSPQKIVTISPL